MKRQRLEGLAMGRSCVPRTAADAPKAQAGKGEGAQSAQSLPTGAAGLPSAQEGATYSTIPAAGGTTGAGGLVAASLRSLEHRGDLASTGDAQHGSGLGKPRPGCEGAATVAGVCNTTARASASVAAATAALGAGTAAVPHPEQASGTRQPTGRSRLPGLRSLAAGIGSGLGAGLGSGAVRGPGLGPNLGALSPQAVRKPASPTAAAAASGALPGGGCGSGVGGAGGRTAASAAPADWLEPTGAAAAAARPSQPDETPGPAAAAAAVKAGAAASVVDGIAGGTGAEGWDVEAKEGAGFDVVSEGSYDSCSWSGDSEYTDSDDGGDNATSSGRGGRGDGVADGGSAAAPSSAAAAAAAEAPHLPREAGDGRDPKNRSRHMPPWALLPGGGQLRMCNSAARALWPAFFEPSRTTPMYVSLLVDIRATQDGGGGGGDGAAAPLRLMRALLRRYDKRRAVLCGLRPSTLLPPGIPWGTALQISPLSADAAAAAAGVGGGGDGGAGGGTAWALVQLASIDVLRRRGTQRVRRGLDPVPQADPALPPPVPAPAPSTAAQLAAVAAVADVERRREAPSGVVFRRVLGQQLYTNTVIRVSDNIAAELFGHLYDPPAAPSGTAAAAAADGGGGGDDVMLLRHITLLPVDWPESRFKVSLRCRFPAKFTKRAAATAAAGARPAPVVQLGPEVWSAVVLYGAEQADVLEVWRRPGGGPEEFCCRVVGPGADARAAARLAAAQ